MPSGAPSSRPPSTTSCAKKAPSAPFTGEYDHTKAPGEYVCAGCGKVLFRSDEKFDSRFRAGRASGRRPTTTPSKPRQDRSYGMVRTEVKCSDCGGHLGHVFDDGPQPDRPALLHQLGGAEARPQVDAREGPDRMLQASARCSNSERSGVLATLSASRDGWPFASVAPYALTDAWRAAAAAERAGRAHAQPAGRSARQPAGPGSRQPERPAGWARASLSSAPGSSPSPED